MKPLSRKSSIELCLSSAEETLADGKRWKNSIHDSYYKLVGLRTALFFFEASNAVAAVDKMIEELRIMMKEMETV